MMSTFRHPEHLLMQSLSKKECSDKIEDLDLNIDPGDIPVDEWKAGNLSSTYGSFIHGSEDEFRLTRIAAISIFFVNLDSMTQIGLLSKKFAILAFPFIIDMFNDEDAAVRLIAVQCVAQLNELWKMVVDDEIIKAVILILRDLEEPVRKFAHQMIRLTMS
jgi:HEAT repeat